MSETLPPPDQAAIDALQGAQVVLDPASKAAQGAKGVYDYLDHNLAHRDAGYVEMGLDPADPNGDVLDPDPAELALKEAAAKGHKKEAPHAGPPAPRPANKS